MKKLSMRITAFLLAITLVTSMLPVEAFASQKNTLKEEVVYINLNTDGSVKEVNVVNIFDLDKKGRIIDYGKYQDLRNMTTTDAIDYDNDTVVIDAKAGKLYYEGKLKDNIIPWKIKIRYYMNGEEYSAKDIAGKSGKLDIKMSVRQNKNCDNSFFKGYALQAAFVLDTNNASNIVAKGATSANVGSDKQLTYTILPNKEKDIEISADVDKFEMDGIAINGVRMDMDIDIDDKSIKNKINDVIDAADSLDDGAEKIDSGTTKIYNATEKLSDATKELNKGTQSLYSGANRLKSGIATLASKNKQLTNGAWSAYKAMCKAAETQLNVQLAANGLKKVTLTPNNYKKVLLNVLSQMDSDKVYKKAYNSAMSKVTKQVEAQADKLYKSYIQSQADTIYLTYIQKQSDELYKQVATQAVIQNLVEKGYTQEQAAAYLQTDEGKKLIGNTVSDMTDKQKKQIIDSAVQNLTTEQKTQILNGAEKSLTKKEKSNIKKAYIEQMMASDEVTKGINKAVKEVNSAAAEVSKLKGQLDGYGVFYNGLIDYTGAVSSAVNGASALSGGLSNLYNKTNQFVSSIGDLHTAVGELNTGSGDLKKGTGKFYSETKNMDSKIDDEINSMTSSITGENTDTKSFVSEKNTNIKSVQFVIKTKGTTIDEQEDKTAKEDKNLTFWQKLLKLFKLYK